MPTGSWERARTSSHSRAAHDPHPITAAAYEAIATTLPFGSVGYEAKRGEDRQIFLWLERRALDRLDALRHPGEGHSEIILRMAQIEASRPGRKRKRS